MVKPEWQNTFIMPARIKRDHQKTKQYENVSKMDQQCPFSSKLINSKLSSEGLDDQEENMLSFHVLIHKLVQQLDSYFGNVCELDIMTNLPSVYYILQEMFQQGMLIDTNEKIVLGPVKIVSRPMYFMCMML